MQANVQISLGIEFCPKTESNFQDCFLTSCGLVTCQVYAVWSAVLCPQPNNSEPANLLQLESSNACKGIKVLSFLWKLVTGKKKGKHIIDPAEEAVQYEFSNCLFCLACQFPASTGEQVSSGWSSHSVFVVLWGCNVGSSKHLCEWCFSSLGPASVLPSFYRAV